VLLQGRYLHRLRVVPQYTDGIWLGEDEVTASSGCKSHYHPGGLSGSLRSAGQREKEETARRDEHNDE
jgi:hypothetical protein